MNKIACLFITALICGCSFSVNVIPVEGNATDLIDETNSLPIKTSFTGS